MPTCGNDLCLEGKVDLVLEAARILAQHGCHDDAASRAYYAAYHATSAAMVHADVPVPSRGTARSSSKRYFRHDDLPADALAAGVLDDETCDRLEKLREWRVRADYYPDELTARQAELALVSAEKVVGHTSKTGGGT